MNIMELDPNKPIKQSNRLVEAKYKLTVYEQRMMICICSQLNHNAAEFNKVRVSVADMAKFCNFDKTKTYSHVKSTIMRLMSRVVQIKMPNGGWYGTHWLQSAEYIPSESIIEYKLDDRLCPELLQLKAAYLSTPAAPLMEFRRDYSARLYFILKKMLKVHEFEYGLDFFRERFQLSRSYDIFFNLKNKVLEPALAEINEKSDINVSHEYIKQGRNYTKIKFVVTLKDSKALPSPDPEESPKKKIELETGQTQLFEAPKILEPQNEEELERLGRLGKYEIAPQTGRRLIKKYGWERIDANLKYAYEHSQRKENMSGWVIDCIKNDRAAEAAEAKRLAKMAAEKKQKEIMARLEPLPFEKEPPRELPEDSPFKKFERRHKTRKANSEK